MLVIYTSKNSPRISYALELVFKTILATPYRIETNFDTFQRMKNPKFVFDSQPIDNQLCFFRHSILEEENITPQEIKIHRIEGLSAFFSHQQNGFALPFDPFAMAFYLTSRYEEYLPFQADKHGRFQSKDSLAAQNNFLQTALIDRWALKIAQLLNDKFPGLNAASKKMAYTFTPSYDIDYAWSYKNKGIKRNAGGVIRDLLKQRFSDVAIRLKVLLGLRKDPFDNFDYLFKLDKKFHLSSLYFLLMADKGTYDKNIDVRNKEFRTLIQSIQKTFKTGIHPSYASNDNPKLVTTEINRLSELCDAPITISRQHYLKLNFPSTYHNLINHGVKEDYTMGFDADVGFRAGTSHPFFWFDLSKNSKTELILHPFAFMDVTLRNYLGLNGEEVLQKIRPLIQEVKEVNGQLMCIFHNNTFSELGEWKNWQSIYEQILEAAI